MTGIFTLSSCHPFTVMATRTAQSSKPVTISRWRLNAVLMLAIFLIGGIVFRLGSLQIVQRQALASRARSEIAKQLPIQPRRGVIRDRMGNVLALDVDRASLDGVPRQIVAKRAARRAHGSSVVLG